MFRQQQQFRYQNQAEVHHKSSTSTSTPTATPTWKTWLACVCRGRLVLKLILGTTVLLLAVNLWPGPQLLLADGHEIYNQLKPVAGEPTKLGEKRMMSPFAENQLMSPPTETQKIRSTEAKLPKSLAAKDSQRPVNSINNEQKIKIKSTEAKLLKSLAAKDSQRPVNSINNEQKIKIKSTEGKLAKSVAAKDSQRSVNSINNEEKMLQSVKDSFKYANYIVGDRYSNKRHFELEHEDINDIDHVSIPLKVQPVINIHPKATIFSQPTKPAIVFLYSSSTRSGSTVFSELVATKSNSILLYEPFKPFLQNGCLKNSSCVNDVLNTSLNCNFKTSKLMRHFKYFFIRTSHHDVERCKGRNRQVVKHCLRKLDIVDLCKKTPIKILKIVRGKLSDLEVFLNNPNIDAKVIHLTRDPRGTIQSVKSLGWLGNTTLQSKCKHIANDLMMFDELHNKYSDKIAKFSIEDFSIDPTRIAEEVFRFLFNEKNLSIKTENFIITHTEGVSKPGPYNTHKDSEQEFQSWRKEIGQRLLQKVELEEPCQQAIAKMGHNLFGDIETSRNLSYSLFDDSYLYT